MTKYGFIYCKVCDTKTGGGDFCCLDHYGKYKKDPEHYDNLKKNNRIPLPLYRGNSYQSWQDRTPGIYEGANFNYDFDAHGQGHLVPEVYRRGFKVRNGD